MKVIILAGGFGTRLAEETEVRPKPMVQIGGMPIIWHIMKYYSKFGLKEFVVCLGYKGDYIKNFFLQYTHSMSDFTIGLGDNSIDVYERRAEDWKVTLLDTGLNTMTGGRIRRALEFLSEGDDVCMTYGDGLSDVDIGKKISFHKQHGKLATVTAVTPPGRFGVLDIGSESLVNGFREKIASDQYRINGGFFVLNRSVVKLIEEDATIWEQGPMISLAESKELVAFEHNGFWHPMDTIRDKMALEDIWQSGKAPWR